MCVFVALTFKYWTVDDFVDSAKIKIFMQSLVSLIRYIQTKKTNNFGTKNAGSHS